MIVSYGNGFDGYLCLFVCLLLQLESLPAMIAGVWSDDNSQQLEATTQFRKLLSIGNCGLFSKFLMHHYVVVSTSVKVVIFVCRTKPSD